MINQIAAEPDEERIRRQAACGVDHHRLGDEGQSERSEAAGRSSAQRRVQREIAHAPHALVSDTPANASHSLNQATYQFLQELAGHQWRLWKRSGRN
jgi:hypothetical protein